MTQDQFDIKVGHGTAQVLSIMGMIGGYGGSIATAIAAIGTALPKTPFTMGLIGAGTIIGAVSNWMLTHARSKTIEAKAKLISDAIWRAGVEVESKTGIDIPVVEVPKPVAPPTI